MAPQQLILVAEPDVASASTVAAELRKQGFVVLHAVDGPAALEIALMRQPSLVLYSEDCPHVDADQFAQILATNHRTREVPVLIATRRLDDAKQRSHRDGVVGKPYNLDEILARVQHLLARYEASLRIRGAAQDIEGGLEQVPVSDVLQLLAGNKRSGRLSLSCGREHGEVVLFQGKTVDASLGQVRGDKALFRLLSWREGAFSFTPAETHATGAIARSMDDALLEGARQAEDRARLAKTVPAPSARLALNAQAEADLDHDAATVEIFRLLSRPRRFSEVLDEASVSDLAVMTRIASLVKARVVIHDDGAVDDAAPILGPAEVHALRAQLRRGRTLPPVVSTKLLVCGSGVRPGRTLLGALPGLLGVAAEPGALRSGFGTLGRLDIGGTLNVDFILLPGSEPARPLWQPFAREILGALVMDDSENALRLARHAGLVWGVPLVIFGAQAVPPLLAGALAGAEVCQGTLGEAVRQLLLLASSSLMKRPSL